MNPLADGADNYRFFAANLEKVLEGYEAPEGTLLEKQRDQFRNLIDLETQFRQALISHPWGPKVYKDFVYYICVERRSILAARPFFRERQTTFTASISPALKARNDKALYQFRFNYMFINYVLKIRKWNPGSKIILLANAIKKQRKELLEQNLPLAISQARQFWGCTPKSHLTYMDLIEIHCLGLILAIDKFTPVNDKKMTDKQSLEAYRRFRSMAIGIMIRDRLNSYNDTLLHYFPKDRTRRYAAHKVLRQQVEGMTQEMLAEAVNLRLKDTGITTTPEEIGGLLASGSIGSADYRADPDGDSILESEPGDLDKGPDIEVENREALEGMKAAAEGLVLREKKLLRLKGVRS
jgi:DNA-directed RNA polymerase specialized sigma subunit